MTDELMRGRCKFCYYNINLPNRCKPEKMISLSGKCEEWRLRKMTDEGKKNEKAAQVEAHARDVAKRKENRRKKKK